MFTDKQPGENQTAQTGLEPLLHARDRFLAYVRKRVADPELAEDILQDSLLRAIRAASDLREADRLVPWFYRVLQHAIIDNYRRRAVDQTRTSTLDGIDVPAQPSDDAELCACFEPLIGALRPEYADVLRSLDLAGESTESVAERLGITPNNLKVRRHRARQALRKQIEATCRTCAEHACLDCTCQIAG